MENSPPFSDISSERDSLNGVDVEIDLDEDYNSYTDSSYSDQFGDIGQSRPNTPTDCSDDYCAVGSVSSEETLKFEETEKLIQDEEEVTDQNKSSRYCSSLKKVSFSKFLEPIRSPKIYHPDPCDLSKVFKIIEENFETESSHLDLSKQNINEIPQAILSLNYLKNLYLKDNKLKKLPNDFFPTLPKLQWLDLRHNRLQSLPKNVGEHPNLKTLLLEGNLLQELPCELGLLSKLEGLSYRNNPLIKPPQEILNLGLKEILYYLRDKLPIYNEENYIESIRPGLRKVESGPVMNIVYKKQTPAAFKNFRKLTPKGNYSFITAPTDPFDILVQRKFKIERQRTAKKLHQEEIEKAVQHMKNQLVLKTWREKVREEQHAFIRMAQSNPDLLKPDLISPYDIDENYRNLPSRKDLLNCDNLDKKIRKTSLPPGFLDSLRYKTQQEIEKEIASTLEKLQKSCQREDISIDEAVADLKKVEHLQRQLSKLFHNILL